MLISSSFFCLSTLGDGKSIKRRNWWNGRVAQHSGFLHFLISLFLDFAQFTLFNQLFFTSPEYLYLKLFFKFTVTLWLNWSVVVWDPSMCTCHCVNSYDEGGEEGAFMVRIHLWTIPEETEHLGGGPLGHQVSRFSPTFQGGYPRWRIPVKWGGMDSLHHGWMNCCSHAVT